MATKQQVCHVRNLEFSNNSTLTTVYDNDNNNQQINKDSRIGNRILILYYKPGSPKKWQSSQQE